MTWEEVCHDERLQDLPYKVELNRHGQIIMSPHRKEHGAFQGRIAILLGRRMPAGEVVSECAVDTSDGTKVADVAWISRRLWKRMGDAPSCPHAPEICVEVWSLSNPPEQRAAKRRLYFDAGAKEVWECDATGCLTFHAPEGALPKSRLCPRFPHRLLR
jgi:Uma2 family endonuclease